MGFNAVIECDASGCANSYDLDCYSEDVPVTIEHSDCLYDWLENSYYCPQHKEAAQEEIDCR